MSALFEDFDEIAELAEALDDPSPGARIMAVIELADSADPAAIPYLARAIADVDAGVRKQAALALTDFDGPETAAALVSALTDSDPAVIAAAAVSLTELKDPASGDAILPHLGDNDTVKLKACLAGIKELRRTEAMGPAIAALKHPDPDVRIEAIGVIGWLQDEGSLPALRDAAKDTNTQARRTAL
ncbi:MAG: HEAT repeat domain-containing protein, partial [Roseobacter sp.]